MDGDERMSSVAAGTSAAPTYFVPFEHGRFTFLYGGIWANNPTTAALVEALSCFTTQPEDIRILSVCCGEKPFQITGARQSAPAWYTGEIS